MTEVPKELNWVEKRAACNIAQAFHQLCLEIGSDIIAINAIKHKDDLYLHFQQDRLVDGSVVIGQPKRTPRVTVTIGVVGQKIMVQDQATREQWSVTVGLNNEGRCVLKLEDGSEFETWQFRKKALDALFFMP